MIHDWNIHSFLYIRRADLYKECVMIKGADTPILLKITSFNLNSKEPKHSHDVTLRNCQNKTNKTIHGLCDATMSWLICCAKVCIHVGIRIDEKLKKACTCAKLLSLLFKENKQNNTWKLKIFLVVLTKDVIITL